MMPTVPSSRLHPVAPTTLPNETLVIRADASHMPVKRVPRSSITVAQPVRRMPEDTAIGCRARAAADLLESVSMTTANQRLRMESSAANWTLRADLLHRLEQSSGLRKEKAEAARKEQAGDLPL